MKLDYNKLLSNLDITRRHWETYPLFDGTYTGEVVSKERPRKSANGHLFTPPKTRKFEEAVQRWANENYKDRPVWHPVGIQIEIFDAVPELNQLQVYGYEVKQHGDIDNKVKSILDACNGYLYRDDKQITSLKIERKYGEFTGFRMTMWRSGLSKNEIETLKKHARAK